MRRALTRAQAIAIFKAVKEQPAPTNLASTLRLAAQASILKVPAFVGGERVGCMGASDAQKTPGRVGKRQ